MALPLNQTNNIIIDGLGSELLITEGLGFSEQTAVDDSIGPSAVITDVVARGLALFIVQFRQLREV